MKLEFTAEQEKFLCEQFGIANISDMHAEQLPFVIAHITKQAEESGVRNILELLSKVGINGHYLSSQAVNYLIKLWREGKGK